MRCRHGYTGLLVVDDSSDDELMDDDSDGDDPAGFRGNLSNLSMTSQVSSESQYVLSPHCRPFPGPCCGEVWRSVGRAGYQKQRKKEGGESEGESEGERGRADRAGLGGHD